MANAAQPADLDPIVATARDAGIRRVVYASSSSVYGDHPGLPKVEDIDMVWPFYEGKFAASCDTVKEYLKNAEVVSIAPPRRFNSGCIRPRRPFCRVLTSPARSIRSRSIR